jgi:carboxyl-terminal processing protease
MILDGCASIRYAQFESSDPGQIFDHMVSLIQKNYVEASGKKIKLDISERPNLSSLMNQLDSSATLFSKDDVVWIGDESNIDSLGFWFKKDENHIRIVKTEPDSPARRADLKYGDRLLEVNGRTVDNLSPGEIMKMLRGEKGSTVSLKIESKSKGVRELVLVQKSVKLNNTVFAQVMDGDIGYLYIAAFWPNTATEVRKAIKNLNNRNIRGLILDLRNNTGGDLQEITETAKMFIKTGLVIVNLKTGMSA